MKTTKGGKVMNPTDAYRKEIRKKELKRNKKERKKVREVGILKKDPDVIKDQIEKLEMLKADGALDKARKHKKRQLEDTLNLLMKKRKEYSEKMKEKGETPVMFSHLGPPQRRTSAEEERAKHPEPEDSVYYHPTLNPTGAPPPGKPPMYKSSIGGRAASSSGAASEMESDDAILAELPVPPPPPLPESGNLGGSVDGTPIPISLPLPPPPPMPPKPPTSGLGTSLPPPPPPPGPPPKDQAVNHTSLPPPPPLARATQPPPPGISEGGREVLSAVSDESSSKDTALVPEVRSLPPPPPPGMLLKSNNSQSESTLHEANVFNPLISKDVPKMVPPPPPPRPSGPGPNLIPTLQSDVLPPGLAHFPPPPPHMHPHLSAPGLPGQVTPQGIMVPLIPGPPYGLPPGPPIMMRPPLPPGPPPAFQDNTVMRPTVPQKPSYVKSAASTVVKRPLAQHTPELTAMVPASVRVRRETAAAKPKPKPTHSSAAAAAPIRPVAPTIVKPVTKKPSAALKPQSIDDSYTAFLEDMKALGALDS